MDELARDVIESCIKVHPERVPERPVCPKCGKEVRTIERERSTHKHVVFGPVRYQRTYATCHACGVAFSPSPLPGALRSPSGWAAIARTSWSRSPQRAQMLASFPLAHKTILKDLPVKLTLCQVWPGVTSSRGRALTTWDHSERVGADLVRRRNHEVMEMLQGRGPRGPGNPPDVLVISPDGGRLQTRALETGSRWCEYKAAVLYRYTRDGDARAGTRRDPQPKCHWKFRTTLGKRQGSGRKKKYRDPGPEIKTFVATTDKINRFPLYVELEARRRGLVASLFRQARGAGGVCSGGRMRTFSAMLTAYRRCGGRSSG
jgi:hypothetical protein